MVKFVWAAALSLVDKIFAVLYSQNTFNQTRMHHMTRSPSPTKQQENVVRQNSKTNSPHSPLMVRQNATCYTPELPEEFEATNSPLPMTSLLGSRSPVSPIARPHAPSPDAAAHLHTPPISIVENRSPTPKVATRSPTPEEDREVREMEKKLEEARKNALAAKERREAEARKRQVAARWSVFAAKALKHDQKLTMAEAGLAAIERKKLKDERVEAERKAQESRSQRFLPGKKQEKVSTGCDCLFSFSRK